MAAQPEQDPVDPALLRTIAGGWRKVAGEATETTLAGHGRRTITGSIPVQLEPNDVHFRAEVGREIDTDISLRDRKGRRMIYYLAAALTRLGEEDLANRTITQRVIHAGMLSVIDLMYLGFLRRSEDDGGIIKLTTAGAKCQGCKAALPAVIEIDLGALPVTSWSIPPRVEYRLARRWFLRGKLVETVTLEHATLMRAMDPLDADEFAHDDLRKIHWVSAGICEVNGVATMVHPGDFTVRSIETGRSLESVDLQGMSGALDAIAGGADMAVDWIHETTPSGAACGAEARIKLDWQAGFFSDSRV